MLKKYIFKIIESSPQTIWTLKEVKDYLRIAGNYDDQLITSLIDAAIISAENFTKLTIMSKKVQFTCNIENQTKFQLKYRPIKLLIKIIILNGKGQVELSNDQYYLDHEQAILYFNEKLDYESLSAEYVVGFDKDNIPASIKHGVLLHIGEMYDRERDNINCLSLDIKNLYGPYRQLKL